MWTSSETSRVDAGERVASGHGVCEPNGDITATLPSDIVIRAETWLVTSAIKPNPAYANSSGRSPVGRADKYETHRPVTGFTWC